MSDIALVTGASGFVGSAVARALVARGMHVRVLMRPTASQNNIAGTACEPVIGDMRDQDSMTAALKGARYLFHVAADYRLWARDPGEIERNNLKGAQASMGAALARISTRTCKPRATSARATAEPTKPDAPVTSATSDIAALFRSKRLAAFIGLPI